MPDTHLTTDHTPEPWTLDGNTVFGPPLPHANDPDARVYEPASVVAILPANYGGAYRYYSPQQRDANGRTIAAAPEMLRALRAIGSLLADRSALEATDVAVIATRCRELLQRHGFERRADTDGLATSYTLDGEAITLDAFLTANRDLDPAEVRAVLALRPGGEVRFGGGAFAVSVLRRQLPADAPADGSLPPSASIP